MQQYRINVKKSATAAQVANLNTIFNDLLNRRSGADDAQNDADVCDRSDDSGKASCVSIVGGVSSLSFTLVVANDDKWMLFGVQQAILHSPIVQSFSSFEKGTASTTTWTASHASNAMSRDSQPLGEASQTSRACLQELPPELRNQIYEMVMLLPKPIILSKKPSSPNPQIWIPSPERKSHVLAMTMVSKKLRQESLALFYACNKFEVRCRAVDNSWYASERELCREVLPSLTRLLQSLKVQGVKRMGALTVDISAWPHLSDALPYQFDLLPKVHDSICHRIVAAVSDSEIALDEVWLECTGERAVQRDRVAGVDFKRIA